MTRTVFRIGASAARIDGVAIMEYTFHVAPGIKESIAEADADIAAGRTYGEHEIRAEFGVPGRAD